MVKQAVHATVVVRMFETVTQKVCICMGLILCTSVPPLVAAQVHCNFY